MIALRLTVHGKVQGVFYRNWTVHAARRLGLTGWVRNQPDGTVAALVQGEEIAVRQMLALMHHGPPRAAVERIEQQTCVSEAFSGFERR
jgi:acylphosphatase